MPGCLTTAVVALAIAVASIVPAPAAVAAGEPVIADSWVSGVSANGADLRAQVNPNGLATSARFEYLTSAAYQANLEAVPPRDGFSGASVSPTTGTALGSGSVAVAYTRHLGGLKVTTSYRYRVSASNTSGSSYGPARSFTTTETAPVFGLPDARGWELVSPIDKNGEEIQGPGEIFGGGLTQAAADGASFTFSSRTSFADPHAASSASQYISRRTAAGWLTENVTEPRLAAAFGDAPDGVPYRLFSADLGRALIASPERCESGPCPRGFDLRANSSGVLSNSVMATDMAFAGARPDLNAAVLSSCKALTASATEAPGAGGCDETKPNLYEWTGASLTAVNLLPDQSTSTPGAELAAPLGAVSADGSRIYFTQAGNLYLRAGAETVQVDQGVGGGGDFQVASASGAIAFFTKEGHLYRFDAATETSADLTPAGEVVGVLGASPDGAYLYYLAAGGLFLAHNGSVGKVAVAADASNYPPATGSSRIAADGTLAFVSSAPLGEFDNTGFAAVYLFRPGSGELICASCNPTGVRSSGPSTIPGALLNGTTPTPYKPRALSSDGKRLFFDSRESLFPLDTNSDTDVYQWEAQGTGSCLKPGGCVNLISSGRAAGGAAFLDASADGSDVFFLTDASLVPADPGVMDVYDARQGGGFAAALIPIACVGDACQVVPGEPDDPTPGTGYYRAEANPPLPDFAKQAARRRAAAKKRAAIKRRAAKRRAAAKNRAAHKHAARGRGQG